MTTAPPVSARRGRKSLYLVLFVGLVLAAGGVAGYVLRRPLPPVIPAIATEGLDAEVVAAIERARAEVVAQPKSPDAWGRLGMVLFAQDLYAECIGPLTEAERAGPGDVRWPYLRGLAMLMHKPEEGIVVLERAAAIPPPNLTVRLRLAEEYVKLERLDEADALFADLLVEHPDNPRVLLGRGHILLGRGQWQAAVLPLETAAKHPTARRSARVALAETYFRLGDAAAEAERQRAAEAAADLAWPDPILAEVSEMRAGRQTRIDGALQLLREGKVREAGAISEQVVRDHPGYDEGHLTLAKVLLRTGAYAQAENELHLAVALNPKLVDGYFLLAEAQLLRKDYAAAQRSYLRTLELKPTYGLAHYHLGECWLKQGDKSRAITAFRDAVRCRPDLAVAHLELGALLLEESRVQEAIVRLGHAVRLDGKNARARTLLAQARAKKGT